MVITPWLGALGVLETTVVPRRLRSPAPTVAAAPAIREVHHCDMALDLALTLVYLEDLRSQARHRRVAPMAHD